ncbi:MAG TPA: Wzz/FepE/Etk N-terminal domain-containing protein [Vicinamibacterales bacterium]
MNEPHVPQSPAVVVAELADIIRRRRRLVLSIVVVLALAAVAIAALQPATYNAEMKFLVRNARTDVMMTPDGNRRVVSPDVSEAEVHTEIELLTSRDLLEQVATATLMAPGKSDPVALTRAVERLRKRLKVEPVRKTNVISVSYAGDDPDQALAVLKTFSDQYLEKHMRVHHTPGAYEFFLSQAEHYRKQLQESRAQLAAFNQSKGIVDFEEQKQLAARTIAEREAALADLDAAINDAKRRVATLTATLNSIEPRVLGETRSLPNQYSAERLTTMLAELRNRRTALLTKFSEDDRLVKEIDQQIADTTKMLDEAAKQPAEASSTTPNPLWQTVKTDLTKAQAELAGLQARRAVMEQQREESLKLIARLEEASPEQGRLLRAVQMAEDNVKLYDAKLEEARIAEALDREKIANVTVAQAPAVPATATSRRPLVLALGLLFALAGGIGGGLTAEYFGLGGRQRVVARGWRPVQQPAHQPLASQFTE